MRSFKKFYFLLAGLNTLATTWYSNYIFFFLRDHFNYGNRQNLWVSALYGFVYIPAAVQCGKFAQRRGFVTSLKVGFAGLMLAMVVGAFLKGTIAGNLITLIAYTVALLFIWPALRRWSAKMKRKRACSTTWVCIIRRGRLARRSRISLGEVFTIGWERRRCFGCRRGFLGCNS